MAKKAVLITEQQFVDLKACGLEVMWDGWVAGTKVTPSMMEKYLLRRDTPSQWEHRELPGDDSRSRYDVFFMAFVDDESSAQE